MKSLVTKNSSNTILLFDREITDIVIIKSSMKVTVNDEKNHACSEKKICKHSNLIKLEYY